ncbi:MAG: hypothetical protein HOP12_07100 [Candidatus Eisenbacteria bacterium]|uniref:Outer membrane protein beta-barrel domain-containing protein n=1 Tax=Eiseniibacteriota bacterium TaxID=2212470 RepID=A0A849SHI7_UNCEI|nr:hypothetical protein [Candidatus Eisenbacteria bacterium]
MGRRLLLTLGLLALVASPSFAQSGHMAGEVRLYHSGATALTPAIFGGIESLQGSVVGVDVSLRGSLGEGPWGWVLGGGFGVGSEKYTDSNAISPNELSISLSSFQGRVGFDYSAKVGEAEVYMGPALCYSSTRGTLDDGAGEEDGEPFGVFGLETCLGGYAPFSPQWGLSAEVYGLIGSGSGSEGEEEISGLHQEVGFRTGLRFQF